MSAPFAHSKGNARGKKVTENCGCASTAKTKDHAVSARVTQETRIHHECSLLRQEVCLEVLSVTETLSAVSARRNKLAGTVSGARDGRGIHTKRAGKVEWKTKSKGK